MQTIIPTKLRKIKYLPQQQYDIETPDDDFLALHKWKKKGSKATVILTHGLGGDALRRYNQGFARALNHANYEVYAWSMRGCGGRMNRQRIFFHSGASYDLETVVQHIKKQHPDRPLFISGISLGGSMTLKYVGEKNRSLIDGAAAFSVPLDLKEGMNELMKPKNKIYNWNFLVNLKAKVREKEALRPGSFDVSKLDKIKTLYELDEVFTAPVHGFESANEYYRLCSSKPLLDQISVPTAIVNAQNDPFLSEECMPWDEICGNPLITNVVSKEGGHVGFYESNKEGLYWSEKFLVNYFDLLYNSL